MESTAGWGKGAGEGLLVLLLRLGGGGGMGGWSASDVAAALLFGDGEGGSR